MNTLFCDLETYSDTPISYGVYQYAEQAEVLLWAYAVDEGPVQVWDLSEKVTPPIALQRALRTPEVMTVWHNGGMFDRVILQHALPMLSVPTHRIHDTRVMALAHSLPGSLEALGEVFQLPQSDRKHKRGRELIQLFCKPQPKSRKLRRATRDTHPTEWKEFIAYAANDVEAMRALYCKLPRWNYQGQELALWQLDQRINARGVCIDLKLAAAAVRANQRAQTGLATRISDLTQGTITVATQRDRLFQLLAANGVDLPDLQASTLQRYIEDPELSPAIRELMEIRLQASKTSVSKYTRLIEATSTDGRLRGLLQFNGASRTGRWAGRLFQPQNLTRPTLPAETIEFGIDALKADVADLLFNDVTVLTRSALRGVIVAPTGKKLVVSDLSNIEGRMLAWLAGEHWKINAFRDFDTGQGPDLYALAYAKSFGVSVDVVMENKASGDGSLRQIGKVQELALGYGGGVGAFLTFSLAYGIDLERMAHTAFSSLPQKIVDAALESWQWANSKGRTFGLSGRAYVVCDAFKRLWRAAHPHVVHFWRAMEDNVRKAIEHPGSTFSYRCLNLRRDGNWLRIRLPSRRSLCYPSPRVDDGAY